MINASLCAGLSVCEDARLFHNLSTVVNNNKKLRFRSDRSVRFTKTRRRNDQEHVHKRTQTSFYLFILHITSQFIGPMDIVHE